MIRYILLSFLISVVTPIWSQHRNDAIGGCAFDVFRNYKPDHAENALFESRMLVEQALRSASDNEVVLNVPVVVHIIHNNGPENIGDAQVQQAIDHLNQAFSNSGPYQQNDGVDVRIQFCLARQNPQGEFSTGINRITNPLTDLSLETQDLALKSLIQWDPLRYLNIWVVHSITSAAMGPGVAAYATFPTNAGNADDGIVNEYLYFGSNPDDSKVLVHEVGHYLGLYHTFEGGCANSNCLLQNDRVCDTPPDASVLPVNCNASYNSCSTDADDTSPQNPFRPIANGGLGDVPDAFVNYMDYGYQICQNQFTQGQKDRMRTALEIQRNTLLQSLGCLSPCTETIAVNLNALPDSVNSGEPIQLQANLGNTASTSWTFNGLQLASTPSAQISLQQQGIYYMLFEARNNDPACTVLLRDTITVVCPIVSSFSINTTQPGAQDSIQVAYTGSGASEFSWILSGTAQASTPEWSTLINTPGQYFISLMASNGNCAVLSDPVTIEIGNNCDAFSLPNDFSICAGDTIQLQADLSSFNSVSGVLWTGGSGTFIPSAAVASPRYVPSEADIAAGTVAFQIRVNANTASISESESLLAYDHNGEDMVFYISAIDGAVQNVQDNTGNDWTAMGYDPETHLLYGLSNIVEPPALWSINVQTNEVLYIAPYSQMRFWAGDYDNVHNIFYAIGMPFGNSVSQTLYRVNTTTGALDAVGDLNLPGLNSSGFYALGDGINGLAYDPSIDALFGVTYNGQLIRINVTDASNVVVGNTTPQLRGLAYDYTNNKLWGISNTATLTRIDKNSGAELENVTSAQSFFVITSLTYAPGILNNQPIACYDSIQVQIHPRPNPDLGPDTAACNGISITLNPGSGFESYQWSTGSTDPQIQVISHDTIWVEVSNAFGCTQRDSIRILQDYGNTLDFSLGPDTIVCAFSIHVLQGPVGDFDYRWWDFSQNPQSTVWQPGTYWLEIEDACGNVAKDTIVLDASNLEAIQLPNDTSLCGAQPLSVSLPVGFSNPVWMDGSTASSWQGIPQQIVWVEASNADGCRSRDTMEVNFFPQDNLPELGPDTVVCAPNEKVLFPGDFSSYLWQDGSLNNQLTIDASGLYWVEVMDSNGCAFRDSITIWEYHPQIPQIDLGPDIFWCDSISPLQLGVPPSHASVLWSTGQNSDSIAVQIEGKYWVRVETWCNLSGTDSIQIAWAQRAAPPLPADTSVCKAFALDGGSDFTQWLWEDGSTPQFRQISAPGTYTLQATTAEGCITLDTITVEFKPLAAKLEIPNAFSPNGDGQNDAFAWILENIDAIELMVFNRWGEKLYQTTLVDGFWDGGGLPDGTYFYRARYHETCSDAWNEHHGWLELMR